MKTDRDIFRESVLKRDNNTCVICKATNVSLDAHHILERRLWDDGGYIIDNGASLCEVCHLQAEMTLISCEDIREAAGISNVVIPEHLYPDNIYTKWGDICLPNGKRCKGELFFDQSVQKILEMGNVLHLYTDIVKYPRTYHLPKSLGRTSDDRALLNTKHFNGKRVIVSLKMDGENTSLYNDYIHARSINSRDDVSKHWVKNFHSTIKNDIPNGWRICGENMWAIHSIEYRNLKTYFYAFSIWNDKNICLSWDESLEWFNLLGLQHVPILYDGIWDEDKIYSLWNKKDSNNDDMEGFVVRTADSFSYGGFRKSVAKFVRKDHVETNEHWKRNIKKASLKV